MPRLISAYVLFLAAVFQSMACDLEALFTVEQKLRSVFANPSFDRRRARRTNDFAGDDGVRLLPFKCINSLGDPQQHLLQALAAYLSLLGLQPPLSDNFARWCGSNDLEYSPTPTNNTTFAC